MADEENEVLAEESVQDGSDEQVEEHTTPRRSYGRQQVARTVRTVKLLNTNIYQGRYLVYDIESLATYLVATHELAFSSQDQPVDQSVLDRSDSPYQWDEEIDSLVITKNEIRLAILRAGHIEQKPLKFKEMVAALLQRGQFPLVKEKK